MKSKIVASVCKEDSLQSFLQGAVPVDFENVTVWFEVEAFFRGVTCVLLSVEDIDCNRVFF